MRFITSDTTDPCYNLALEEYMVKIAGDEPLVRLWQNRPSVIIGRHQNTVEEINADYIEANGVSVIRRITGGGAVYHDLGNMNYTLVEKTGGELIDFRRFTAPVIRLLNRLGIPAELSGRNDMTIDGRKFSGNAQFIRGGKVLHHGTLLYASRLEDVQEALRVRGDKIESKGVKSVRSRVCNITDFMTEIIPLPRFRDMLLEELFQGQPLEEYALTEKDRAEIRQLVEERYGNWDWNYGESPKFNQEKRRRFLWGELVVRLQVEGGWIRGCTINGDFFSNADMNDLTSVLVGAKHSREEVTKAINAVNIARFFPELSREEFTAMIV